MTSILDSRRINKYKLYLTEAYAVLKFYNVVYENILISEIQQVGYHTEYDILGIAQHMKASFIFRAYKSE